MPYDNITDATSVGKLIPEQTASEILKNVPQRSAALSLFRRVPLSTRVVRQNVLSALPMAYFVNGDTGLKQTTELAWSEKVFTVEEIATILPLPQNVVDDLSFDIWGEARPLIEEAFGRVIDAAIFFGTNKPASWPASVVDGAVAASNDVDFATTVLPPTADFGPLFVDRFSDVMSEVEDDGFDVNGIVSYRGLRGVLRKLRDENGNKLFDMQSNTYEGQAITFAMDGMWPTGDNRVFVIMGDFTKGIIGVRKDITYELFREGVIQDNTGAIIFNLMQQDMIAMRVTMRLAWQTANPISYANPTEATRYPFSVGLWSTT